jgi:hypothetical protein
MFTLASRPSKFRPTAKIETENVSWAATLYENAGSANFFTLEI